jgi:hypothetical protein
MANCDLTAEYISSFETFMLFIVWFFMVKGKRERLIIDPYIIGNGSVKDIR